MVYLPFAEPEWPSPCTSTDRGKAGMETPPARYSEWTHSSFTEKSSCTHKHAWTLGNGRLLRAGIDDLYRTQKYKQQSGVLLYTMKLLYRQHINGWLSGSVMSLSSLSVIHCLFNWYWSSCCCAFRVFQRSLHFNALWQQEADSRDDYGANEEHIEDKVIVQWPTST